jgi:uncharacterized protein YecT (DUF1311 family)
VKKLLAIAAVLVASLPATAQEQLNCANPGPQIEMNMCAWQAFEKADAELNQVWKEAQAAAKALDVREIKPNLRGAAKALLDGQRGWIAYRDGNCELAGWEMRGGSAEPMVKSGCLELMTKARTKELREFVSMAKQ